MTPAVFTAAQGGHTPARTSQREDRENQGHPEANTNAEDGAGLRQRAQSICDRQLDTFGGVLFRDGPMARVARPDARDLPRMSWWFVPASRLGFRLIHVSSWASASCHEHASVQVMDGGDQSWTHHRSPENRKVDGSTPPLATPSHQTKRSVPMIFSRSLSNWLSNSAELNLVAAGPRG
jgi:hypothetical protein